MLQINRALIVIGLAFMGCQTEVPVELDSPDCAEPCVNNGGENDNNAHNSNDDPRPDGGTDEFDIDHSKIDITSKIVGGKDNGFIAVEMDSTSEHVLLSMPLPIIDGLKPINGSLGAFGSVSTTKRGDGSYVVRAKIPIDQVFQTVERGQKLILANGQPLPGSDLPVFKDSVLIEGTDLYVYAGANTITVRIESDRWAGYEGNQAPLHLSYEMPIRNAQSGMNYGTLAMYAGSTGGFFLTVLLPTRLAEQVAMR